ncbi:MAG: Excinuclease ABC subunit C [Parcubacteria group bacterium GW2011_GWA1_40_21]|nr:MAG: Excinuclease ABC subunit C [Parcubacteria group bacterium GW2011_GWC1_40_13]KKR53022.1 MAG: Excinuclease ABC subunit C [Parcubacteria group bacterium GW2011_GWA1_40_21]
METKKKGCVYILKGNNSKFYVGSTNDLERRLKQHNNDHTQTTKKMNGFKLVLSQEYDSLLIARKIEMKIKNLKRKDCIEKMINDGYIRLTA